MKRLIILSTLAFIAASAFGIYRYSQISHQSAFQHMYDDGEQATTSEPTLSSAGKVVDAEPETMNQDYPGEILSTRLTEEPQEQAIAKKEKPVVLQARKPKRVKEISYEDFSRGEIMPMPEPEVSATEIPAEVSIVTDAEPEEEK
ncbi:MAG: hypothetical protein JNJ58_08860 [Chitinophagaceae bacterium]|nr:hypothetical protein [Chitinophagaceae bacterium]